MDVHEFKNYLIEELASNKEYLNDSELEAVKKLCREKYDAWEWNFGQSPEFDFRNRVRYSGGSLEVRICVAQGIINNIQFFGDFMALRSVKPIEEALCGKRFDRACVKDILLRFELKDYFGTIICEEILNCIFE